MSCYHITPLVIRALHSRVEKPHPIYQHLRILSTSEMGRNRGYPQEFDESRVSKRSPQPRCRYSNSSPMALISLGSWLRRWLKRPWQQRNRTPRSSETPNHTVSLIEYQLIHRFGQAREPDAYRLITTLLDPDEAPAPNHFALYHRRLELNRPSTRSRPLSAKQVLCQGRSPLLCDTRSSMASYSANTRCAS